MPWCQSTSDFRACSCSFSCALHRDRNARSNGLLVYEHHPGRNSSCRLWHRLFVTEIINVATDQSHFRGTSYDLRSGFYRRSTFPFVHRQSACTLHVICIANVKQEGKPCITS